MREPEATLRGILAHLGLPYDPAVIDSARGSSVSTYEETWRDKRSAKQWQSTPGDPISGSSIGKFRDGLTAEQLSTLYRIRLTDKAAEELETPVRTFAELLEYLEYDLSGVTVAPSNPVLHLRELRAEISDHLYRAGRSLRYTKRFPAIVTTVGR
ncbi:MAG: hypothetical protein E4H00_06985 [Myxococcales bacterium]|nr:MAG: hypothetical protein E4H00_06985 [Myxococcales bacterium]